MSNLGQQQIIFTYIESPINQVAEDIVAKGASIIHSSPEKKQQLKDASIGRRLEDKIKQIEEIQKKYEHSKKGGMKFKDLRNNLVTQNTNSSIIPTKFKALNQRLQDQTPFKALVPLLSQNKFETGRRLNFDNITKSQHQVKNPYLLENCLRQIGEVKKTIKQLKQRCQYGSTIERKIQPKYIKTEKRYNQIKYSRPKSQHKYTNYHDLSIKHANKSYDRLKINDKSFNWIRNITQVKQFIIDTSGDQFITTQK